MNNKFLNRVGRPTSRGCALVAALLISHAGNAAIVADFSDDGSNLIVLRSGWAGISSAGGRPFIKMPVSVGNGQQMMSLEIPKCPTIGSQLISKARSTELSIETFYARYALVQLWSGQLCGGVSDVIPTSQEAVAWLLDLSARDSKELPDVSALLVDLYVFGARDIAPDCAKALGILKTTTTSEVAFGGPYLAYCFEHGNGIAADRQQAREWVRKATEANSYAARIILAQAKELGIDEPRNESAAFQDYLSLAKGSSAAVKLRLGLMYLEGRGTKADACQAKFWLQQSMPHAKKYLEEITTKKLCLDVFTDTTRSERSMITSRIGSSTQVDSVHGYGAGPGDLTTSRLPARKGELGTTARSQEEVESVFDRNKGALYSIYSRLLRDKPDAKGKVVLAITIATSGEVTNCNVVASEIQDVDFERRLVARIRLFRFPEANVAPLTLTKPIDFFPVQIPGTP